MRALLQRFLDLDRRWIFLLVGLSATVPFLFPLPGGGALDAGEPVRAVYRRIESLPPGSVVWMGFDFYATTMAETAPGARAVVRHLFEKDAKLVVTSLVPDGALLSRQILSEVAGQMGRKYGTDYVILGYVSGSQIAIKRACEDLHGVFPIDAYGNPIGSLPLAARVRKASDFTMVFTASDNMTFDYFAIVANTQYGLPVAGATTAVMVPGLYPYYKSGQIYGMLGGMRGAAEYEGLIHRPGAATAGMAVQSVVHFLIAFGIVLGNVAWFAQGRPGQR